MHWDLEFVKFISIFILWFIENKIIESDDKEKNGEPKNPKSRNFRLPQHETNLTPLFEGNNADLID